MDKKLPTGWIFITLGELFLIERGGSPRPIENYITDSEDGINWIKIGDTKGITKYIYKTKEKIKPEGLYKSRMVYEDDFILSNSMSFGRPYIMKTKGCIHDGWLVIRPNKDVVDLNFLYYMLSSSFVYQQFSSLAKGSTVKNLNIVAVQQVYVYLPPLPEQQRIVAKLDTLFGQIDRIKTSMERIPQLLKDFRQKVLTQAVSGKLTEEWREGKELEDIKILFSKMDFRRGQHKKSKISNLKLDLRIDLDLFELPSKWSWADLNFLMDEENSFCYGVVQPGKDVKNEQKLIRVQDLSNGKILNDQLRGISWKIDKEYTRSKVNEGDLLVTVVGTIGRTAIVAKENIGLNIARAVAKIPVRDCNGKYIRIFFDSEIAQQWLVGDAREVARKTLNLDQLKTLPIAVPPIEEQQEIVRRVESLFAKADQIETSYQKLKVKIEQLPQALLAKAFRGELVEQLPTDGDARDLLEQIKQAKAGLEKSGKSKKLKVDDEVRMVAEEGVKYGE